MKSILKFLSLIYFNFIFTNIYAQSPLDPTLQKYSLQFPQEKLHLHTDKETYLPGETIWFKAYILADDMPTTQSTNLYVDLIDATGKLLEHKTMPILAATADSYFKLPDSSTQNKYTLKAYSTWMLNFDTAFIYQKTITVFNNKAPEKTNEEKTTVALQFFAEGGNMLAEQYNYVAFKATQNNGQPYNITAAIKNSKNEFIDSIATEHDGMGLLKFTPQTDEVYSAEWKDNNGDYRKTQLPTPQTQGIQLHAEQSGDNLFYLINKTADASNLNELTLVATMYQKIVYKAAIKMSQQSTNQKINTKDFATGILQLTVFNSNNQPLAERIVFINNNNYAFDTKVTVTEKSTAKRGKNTIEIEIPDTLSSNLSVAVYDANLTQQETNRNIYTDLLLQGDLKGYVHNASWYFSNKTPQAKAYLDLVMQTNGWRRYNWDKIVAAQLPTIIYPKDNFLSIYGKATDAKQQGAADQLINLIVQAKDSSKQWYAPVTGKDGSFTQNDLIFYDTATILYKLNDTKNKTINVGIAPNYNGLTNTKLNNSSAYIQHLFATETTNTYTQIFVTEVKNKNVAFEQKAKVLNEVIVKSKNSSRNWKNDPIEKMDEKYTSMFRGIGPNTWAFDVMHDEMALAKLDIYNYLIGKVPGLSIKYVGTVKKLAFRLPGNAPPPPFNVFVNEFRVDDDYLDQMNVEDIAYIKFYEHTPWIQGFGSSISIYTLKGDDLKESIKNMPSNLTKIKIAGYSPTKEFYSPDYTIPNDNHSNADLRSTLLWLPYILTDKQNKKATLSFYNNDITTRLKVVIEGMNEDGKLVHVEKIIE